jgi:pyruvate formate lyase activating enzyme
LPPVRGLDPVSLTAWEGRVVAVLHLQGCNLACPDCPVPHLVPRDVRRGTIPVESVLQTVYLRRRWLDAVVLAGGEPTLHEGLPDLVHMVREFGLPVRVHTNGTNPDMLRVLLDEGIVASLAMTVRAPLDPTYQRAAGMTSGTKVRLSALYESVERILRDGGEHEFRIPWLPGIVEHDAVVSVAQMLSGARRIVLDPSKDGRPGPRALRRAARAAGVHAESCIVAGRPDEDFGMTARQSARAAAATRGSRPGRGAGRGAASGLTSGLPDGRTGSAGPADSGSPGRPESADGRDRDDRSDRDDREDRDDGSGDLPGRGPAPGDLS